tara:strand:- start:347 stop:568 length:222 start_codon:yes stop_codon:yes gene_type:complete
MRTTYVFLDGKIVEKSKPKASARLSIMRDIDTYKSIVTGEEITSRSSHREHLRRHNLVEIGNEQQTNFNLERD